MPNTDTEVVLPCTDSVRRILRSARAEAQACDRSQVGSQDLLSAFCREPRGLARRVLESLGVRPIELGTGLFLADGALDPSLFDPALWSILQAALKCARDKGHNVIGRVHVIYAMLLSEESALARRVREQGQDPARLAGMFYAGFPARNLEKSSDLELKASAIKGELRYLLCVVEKEMRDNNSRAMEEGPLLKVLARDGGGATGAFLEHHGIRWRE